MARNSEINAAGRAREMLFVGACAAVFVVIAACAIYAVVTLAI
ncbi:MAG TPA: hypothetical protein VN806_05570 [Caulobacteraceae bacterium]|jgi:hypothetical protein|nr:hypothetical protein [Caulobacteraceae bacterium]